ncbi:MAG: wax ester/triacylglycerol synthase family O-acyltransferase, partial [Actinomycetota bacterium]|nr:wax ester/triacylglycerol synthase family O-acyltransferase [Actinomycetota bacterium]
MRRFAGLDGAFLAFESPAAPLHIVGVLVFDPTGVPNGVGFDEVRALVARRLPRVPPFRQRPVAVPFGLGHGGLVDDPRFDLDYHVRRSALPRPGGRSELAGAVAEIVERPLDRTRPLWEFHVLEGVEGGRFALVTKVHHAIIDGVSGAELLAAFFDLTPHPGPQPVDAGDWTPPPVPGELGMVRDALGDLPARLEGVVRATTGTVRLARRLSGRNRQVDGTLPPSPFDAPRTSLNGSISPHRRVAFAEIPLAAVDEVRAALGGSVNDVVLAAVGGGLRRLLAMRGEQPDSSLVAMVPVSVRTADDRGALGNRVAPMLVSTASGVADDAARLRLVSEEMAKAKAQHRVVGADPFATWADALAPVVAIAGELEQRDAANLKPLPVQAAPAELTPLLHAINTQFARIDALLTRERRFTADAAHEMRTPLAVLRAQWDVVRRARDEPERAQAQARFSAGLDRMYRLVTQMLAL